MVRAALAGVLLSAALGASAQALEMPSREFPMRPSPSVAFRAPELAASASIAVVGEGAKAAAAQTLPAGRLRVGTERALAKAQPVTQWIALDGAFVTRLEASSEGAQGLRAKLDVSRITGRIEVRVQGSGGPVELLVVQPGAAEAWTPWTEGPVQAIEISGREPQAVSVASVLHFDLSPFAKAAGSCTVPTACTTGDSALDAAIAQRKRSVIKIQFVEEGRAFVCTATLINTERAPAGYVLTANHCVNQAAVASTVTSFWFHENTACDAASAVNPAQVQVAGGMQFVFGNHNVDSTLLLMNQAPPAGAVYSGWSAADLPNGTAVTSLSHPAGDTSRLALGSTSNRIRVVGRPQDMSGVRFTRGIIEGGSSGSGLFTLSGGSLVLRGVLSGSTIRNGGGMSCTNLNEEALYGRLEIFQPEIDPYIRTAAQAPDDAPNRHTDLPPADPAGADAPLNTRSGGLISHNNKRIDYAGDVDIYRFVLTAPAAVSAWSEGPGGANLDSVGNILDASGVSVEANDDAETASNHFGVTRYLQPGTYHVQVTHFEPRDTGAYNLRIRADEVESVNHTALWWNPAESGWGLNVNHQGNKVFATLFTYDAGGRPLWLVMSDGARTAPGVYEGTLYRTTGPAFNASPFGAISLASVGTMRIAFTGEDAASVTYTFNGTQVAKNVARQVFGTLASCTWSAFDRSFSDNYQDLWSNPDEPGWGVNLTHQGNTIFATLFTYDASGQGVWLVMSNGALAAGSYSGALYRMSGPAFNASPWGAATPVQVGTMTFTPDALAFNQVTRPGGTLTYTFNGVTVTKRIERQVFGSVKPQCE